MSLHGRRDWFVLLAFVFIGALLWIKFSLPRYEMIDLRINQSKAVALARDFLASRPGADPHAYKVAAVFIVDEDTDRYLQKTIGTKQASSFLSRVDYDMFCWVVRFFKEKQREEYKVTVSSKTGQIIGYSHEIEDTAARPPVDNSAAREQALGMLKGRFGFDPARHTLYREDTKKFDNRQEHTFVWSDNNADIPWKKELGGGEAKLLTTVVVAGPEVRLFSKGHFEIPEGFGRYIENLKQTGDNLTLVFRLMYLGLLTLAIMMVVNRKQHLVPRTVRPFYIFIGAVFFILMLADGLNGYQFFQFNYPTSQAFFDYVLRQLIENLINPFFIVLAFILPGMAGEALRYEVMPAKVQGGFLNPVLSSFASRAVARQIFFGYAVAVLLLGAQGLIFEWGHTCCGVWDELSWLTQSSTAVVPALSAMLIGFHASFSEEVMFRLFAINLLKKYRFNTFAAVFTAAAMWGFGHTGYAIFPMWFRGVEVTVLGLLFGFAYLRYGLITTVTAHYLMDSFLTALPYLMKPHQDLDFWSSLAVICLPLLLALAALKLNRSSQERPLSVRFNREQEFNYGLLLELARSKSPDQLNQLKQKLLGHGWDPAVVKRAIDEA